MKKLAALLLFAALPAAAAAPDDFAFGWPVELPGGGDAWQIELTQEIHRVLATDDQSDLALFDGAGNEVPLARYEPPPAPPREETAALPVFPLPRDRAAGAVDARLRLERSTDGSLRQIEANLASAPDAAPITDYLVDASRIDEPIDALLLRWETGRVGRYAVETSDDLENWRTLVPAATVAALEEDGGRLERRRIPLPAPQRRYLLLRAQGESNLGALRVEALFVRAQAAPALQWIEATLVSGSGASAEWDAGGAFDVRAVRVVPRGVRSLSTIVVRGSHGDGFLERGRLTLFDVAQGGDRLVRDEAQVAGAWRSRRWQLEATPPLDAAPRLLLGVRPDRFAFVARGEGPLLLAAGSGTARREAAPVEAAIEAIARREGRAWQPPVATLGARRTLGGEEALTPRRQISWATLVLWTVLAGGALAVAALAVRLLRGARP